jgi:hypothetical protein
MIEMHSSNIRKEVESLRDKILKDKQVSFQVGKEMQTIKNPRTRITTNKYRVHILWIDKQR